MSARPVIIYGKQGSLAVLHPPPVVTSASAADWPGSDLSARQGSKNGEDGIVDPFFFGLGGVFVTLLYVSLTGFVSLAARAGYKSHQSALARQIVRMSGLQLSPPPLHTQ